MFTSVLKLISHGLPSHVASLALPGLLNMMVGLSRVPILVKPVGLPCQLGFRALTTSSIMQTQPLLVQLRSCDARALRDRISLHADSNDTDNVIDTFLSNISSDQLTTHAMPTECRHRCEDSNINTAAVTNVNDQSCDAVARERDPSACVFFEIGEDDDGCSSASDTEQFSCGEDLCDKATLDLPAIPEFPAMTDTLTHDRGCANITDIP